jgi:hypothetical protein
MAVCALGAPPAPGGWPSTAWNSQCFPDLIILKGIPKATLVGCGSFSVSDTVCVGTAGELRRASHVLVDGGFFRIRHAFLLGSTTKGIAVKSYNGEEAEY